MEGDLAKGGVHGPEVHLERLQMQCFKSAWIANVLHEGLGVPRVVDPAADVGGPKVDRGSRRPPLFQSVNNIKDIQVSWTLGAVLLQASRNIPVPLAGDDGDRGSNPTESKETFSFPKVILQILCTGAVVILIVRCRRIAGSALPTYQNYQRQGDDSSTLRSNKYPFRFFFIFAKKGMEAFRNTRIAIASLVAPNGTRVVAVGGGGGTMSFGSYSAPDLELDDLVLHQTGETADRPKHEPPNSSNGEAAVQNGPVRTVANLPKNSYNRKRRGDLPDSTTTTSNNTNTVANTDGSTVTPATNVISNPVSSTPQPYRPNLSILLASYSNTPSSSSSSSPWSTNNVKPPSPALWSNAKVTGPAAGTSVNEEEVAEGEGYSMRRSHSGNCVGGK